MRRSRVLVHVLLALGALGMVAPFIWQFLTSLKTLHHATQVPPTLAPDWRWQNYAQIFDLIPFGQQFLNTVLMTGARAIGQVLFCSMAAYAFARLRFPGRTFIFGIFLSVLMVPPQLFIIPQYEIIARLGWLNSLPALIVPGLFSAFGTFLLRQFFLGLPVELDEAARLDGANPLRIWWSIMLPLARPGLVALGILTTIWSWNDFFWPLVVNNDPEKMTLSAGLASLQGQFMTDYPVLMAGSLLASLPVIAVFVVMQRQFVQGIAFTGTKG
ncbi:carbohydrate ABC transporter permease [Catenuloplanes japonicus]|uniref:carbohydrate ABC transporter permease n=1 Tax=Catenuloplanes japonicus TaxID=33876 RepID=UPI0005248AB4|nr:carbohydrate ABC transporter permease [Catenuloplanes japonicus]